jgi:antitoxin component YwqK of YwqJK toxin-antitoxin module
MKYLAIISMLFSFIVSAQESIEPKFEKEGDLTKVVFFHENGEVAQTGYFKDQKCHGNWVSYEPTGRKSSMGSYDLGKKSGPWFFWKGNDLIEVIYEDNKIVNVLEWNNGEKKLIASDQ